MKAANKLAHLLPHWIEHNTSHAEQFEQYARNARTEGLSALADHVEAAAKALWQANGELERARDRLPREEA